MKFRLIRISTCQNIEIYKNMKISSCYIAIYSIFIKLMKTHQNILKIYKCIKIIKKQNILVMRELIFCYSQIIKKVMNSYFLGTSPKIPDSTRNLKSSVLLTTFIKKALNSNFRAFQPSND